MITRAGEGTKIIFTGNIKQIDQPYLDGLSNGLSFRINRMENFTSRFSLDRKSTVVGATRILKTVGDPDAATGGSADKPPAEEPRRL